MDNPLQQAFQPKLGAQKPSQIPTPNMKQAGQMPQAQPSPFPSSGFQKQGMGGGGAAMPSPNMQRAGQMPKATTPMPNPMSE